MKRTLLASFVCLTLLVCSGCSGTRSAHGYYTVHAESFRIFGFAIPRDDQEAAAKLHAEKYPAGTVTSNHSTAADWTSVMGVLQNLFGFHCTQISGTTK